MKSEILLSIAIPTYNQPIEIEKTIKSLIKQIDENDIEVLVLDDSDNVKTEKILKKYENIKYYRGKKVHVDYAELWLMKKAIGKYVWWFGDDVFYPDAIKKIKEILKFNPDFVWINSNSHKKIKTKNIGCSTWMTGSEVIYEIGDLLIFLSSLLWKRKLYLSHIHLGNDKIGTCMAPMYPQIEALSFDGKFYYCDDPLFYSHKRDFSELWYDPFNVFSKNYFDLLESFYHKTSISKALKQEKKKRGIQILKGVIFYKYKSQKFGLGLTTFKQLNGVYYKWLIYWVLMPLIIFVYMKQYIKNDIKL